MSLLPPPPWLKRASAQPPTPGFPEAIEVVGTERPLTGVNGAIGSFGDMKGLGTFGRTDVGEKITFITTWADDGADFVRGVPIRVRNDDPCGDSSGVWSIDDGSPGFVDKHGIDAAAIDWQPGRRAVAVQCEQVYRCGGIAGIAYEPITITLVIARTSSGVLVATLDKRTGPPPDLAGTAPVPTHGYTVAQHAQAWSDWELDPTRNTGGNYRPHDWQEVPVPDDPLHRIPA